MGKRLRWVFLSLAGLLLVDLVCFGHSTDPKITGLRNILHYKVVKALGGPAMPAGEPAGVLAGTVRGVEGEPLVGAVVLVASPWGHTYTAETDSAGHYRISGVPPGCYVPVAAKSGYDDALQQVCIAGLCRKDTVPRWR